MFRVQGSMPHKKAGLRQGFRPGVTQSRQKPCMKEYNLNHMRFLLQLKASSLVQGLWSLWVRAYVSI